MLSGARGALARPAWLTALLRMKREVWKLRVPLLSPVPEETIEALGLAWLWTALDPTTVEEQTVAKETRAPEEQVIDEETIDPDYTARRTEIM